MRKAVHDLIDTMLDTAVRAICQHTALVEHCATVGLESPKAEDIVVYMDVETGRAGWLWSSNPVVKAMEHDPHALLLRAVQIAEPAVDDFVGLAELSARLTEKTRK